MADKGWNLIPLNYQDEFNEMLRSRGRSRDDFEVHIKTAEVGPYGGRLHRIAVRCKTSAVTREYTWISGRTDWTDDVGDDLDAGKFS